MGWTTGVLFLPEVFATEPRPSLGPPSLLSSVWPGPEAEHSFPSSVEVKECVELYLHSTIHLYGI